MNKKTVIYTNLLYSLPLHIYAQKEGLKVVKVFEEKEDYEFLDECLSYLKKDESQLLLVHDLSQMGKSLSQVADNVRNLTNMGINIYCQDSDLFSIDSEGKPTDVTRSLLSLLQSFSKLQQG